MHRLLINGSTSFIPTEQDHDEKILPPRPTTSKKLPEAQVHQKFETVSCMYCDKTFGRQRVLDTHLIIKHNQGNTLECIFFFQNQKPYTGGPPLTRFPLTRIPLTRFLAYVRVSGGISVSRGPQYSPTNTNFM